MSHFTDGSDGLWVTKRDPLSAVTLTTPSLGWFYHPKANTCYGLHIHEIWIGLLQLKPFWIYEDKGWFRVEGLSRQCWRVIALHSKLWTHMWEVYSNASYHRQRSDRTA